MGRRQIRQLKIGSKENRTLVNCVRKIKQYRIFPEQKNKRETSFNTLLMDYLRQHPKKINVSNKNIPSAEFVGETFRPEFFVKYKSKPICCIECKRLTDATAKARWKEGISQALIYTSKYKAVILVLFDFTKDSRYFRKFGPGNSVERTFASMLRKEHNIYMIVSRKANV